MKHWETYSNLAFVAAGLYIGISTSWLWGVGIILMGLGSIHGHATGDYKLDWFGMYTAFIFQLMYFQSLITEKYDYVFPLLLLALFLKHDEIRRINIRTVNLHFIAVGVLYAGTFALSFFVVDPMVAFGSGLIYAAALYIRKYNHGMWHVLVSIALCVLTF